jgi:hypothetical protein
MPDKRNVSFSVPEAVQQSSQTGWVYRSDQAPAPTRSTQSAQSSQRIAAPRARQASASWVDEALELLVVPFSLPICLILSATTSSRRRSAS